MIIASRHPQETERLQVVEQLNILDTPTDSRFEIITQQAKERFQVAMSAVTILDATREWYKSCAGDICPIERQGGRDVSFCGHALLSPSLFVIQDTLKDERFFDNPMVVNAPHIRFYAGMALLEYKSHLPVGVFCIKDTKPRVMTSQDVGDFLEFAHRVEILL